MSDKKVIEKIKEYLKDNEQSESLDIQTDSNKEVQNNFNRGREI